MSAIAGLTARTIVLFIIVTLGQIGGSMTLGRTEAFRNLGWSAVCIGIYAVSFWALATMIREGGPLSLIMPLLAAIVPLIVVLLSVFVMGEAASWTRLGLLVFACLVIGYAGTV